MLPLIDFPDEPPLHHNDTRRKRIQCDTSYGAVSTLQNTHEKVVRTYKSLVGRFVQDYTLFDTAH